jgi:Ferritin-like domain
MSNTITDKTTSRRHWLTGPAALAGAGAITAVLARAQSTGSTTNDINILNFALRLENLESAFYNQGLAMLAPRDFQNSAAIQAMGGTKIGANVYSYLIGIRNNEVDHATKLVQLIAAMGGTPQPLDCYNFGVQSADDFLRVAQILENTGVAAYDGAIAGLQNPELQTAAATIATVEARHAAYLNLLNFTIPFPTPFDTTQTMPIVLSTIGQYLNNTCNPQPVQLTYAQAGPTKHAIITTNNSTIRLDGTRSTSANGQPLTYLWNQVLGSPLLAILNDQFPMATAILMSGPGEYSLALQVTDSSGNSDQDSLKIIYQP